MRIFKKINILKLIFVIILLILNINQIFGTTVVVSSNQDKDIAIPLSNYLNASLIIIPWGTIDEKYLNEIKSKNPDKVIIIGGEVSVPKFYEYGNYSRYAGMNRLETALTVLKHFYGISTNGKVLYYPSKIKILEYINKSENWNIYYGKSNVSIRWGNLVKNELKYNKGGKNVSIYIGNINNNRKIEKNWVENLSKILSYCPSVILNNDKLYILGGDNNLPITIRDIFTNKNWDYFEVFKFILLVFVLIVLFYRYINSPYYLIVILIVSQYILSNLDRFIVCWDSLFVYIDGALSLHYLGHYETILCTRGFPGLSYLLNLWFYAFKPSFESVYLYQIMMLFLLISGLFLYFKNKLLPVLTLFTLLLISTFTKYIFVFSTELTYLTIMLWVLMLIELSERKNIVIKDLFSNLKEYMYKLANNGKNNKNNINNKNNNKSSNNNNNFNNINKNSKTNIDNANHNDSNKLYYTTKKYLNNISNKIPNILLISILTVLLSSIRMIGSIIPIVYFVVRRNTFGVFYLLFTAILEILFVYTVCGNDISGYFGELSVKGGITYNLIVNNIMFYKEDIINYSIVPVALIVYWVINNGKITTKNIHMLILAIVNLIMVMFWVATDKRYLLPYLLLITIYAFKIYDDNKG